MDPDEICYECTGYGDNWCIDEDGELVCACDECFVAEMEGEDDECK